MKEDSSSFDDILNEADEEETETVETPAVEAATEAPAVEESVEEVTQPSAPDGFTQDARGVWHRPDGTIAAKEEVAKFGAAGSGAEVLAPGPDSVSNPTPPTPFSFKSQGQDFPLDGATLDKDGNLVVSKSNLATVQQMFARATEFPTVQGREARVNHELTQSKTQIRELSGRAEQAEFAYQHLAAILDSPEKLTAFLTDPREKEFALRELQLGIQNARLTRQSAERQTETQAQSAEQTTAQEIETITNAIDLVAKSPDLQPLAAFITPEDLSEAKGYFKEMRGAIVKTAEDDSLVQYGIQKGEKYVVHGPMMQYLKRIATERKTAKDSLDAATKAHRFNQAQVTPAKPVQPKRSAVAVPANAKKTKSWDEKLKDAWADDEEE